jgi:hypothetical protein
MQGQYLERSVKSVAFAPNGRNCSLIARLAAGQTFPDTTITLSDGCNFFAAHLAVL